MAKKQKQNKSPSLAVPLFLYNILFLWILPNDASQMMKTESLRKVRVLLLCHRSSTTVFKITSTSAFQFFKCCQPEK